MAGNLDSADGNLRFKVTPMVDVVFVLMLFFMATVAAAIQAAGVRKVTFL